MRNSQLEFSQTISLAQTSNTSRTPSLDSWVSIVDKVWSRPTWSELLRVAWDFDSPWITGPMTAHQSVAYVRHIILAPAANLCTLSAIVFLPMKAWIWCHLRRYIDGSAILLTVKGPVWPRWLKICHASQRKLCGKINGISIKSLQFVTNFPYQTIIYSKHNHWNHHNYWVECVIIEWNLLPWRRWSSRAHCGVLSSCVMTSQ